MPQRRRFAKNSEDVRHFRLVARSQNDGRADDPDAPPLVLEPCMRPGDARKTGLTEAELLQPPDALAAKHPEVFADPNADHDRSEDELGDENENEEHDEEDLEGDCYFPQDGYNYDQHLKRVSGTGKAGGVVGVILESTEKVPEKELKMQAPATTEEEEVMRALEKAEEYEELEDGALEEIIPGGAIDVHVQTWGPSAAQDTNLPDLAAFKAMHAARMAGGLGLGGLPEEGEEGEEFDDLDEEEDDEEADGAEGAAERRKARGKAAASSTAAPSKSAAADAAEFEEFFAAEYGEEDDVGALDDEEVEGPVAIENVEEVLDEYLVNQQREMEHLTSLCEPQRNGRLDDVPRVIEETRAIIERHYNNEDEEESETSAGEEETDESRTWDCESVLSTLSNVSNRPGRIGKINVIKKPAPAMKPVKEEDEDEESEGDDVIELPDVVTERPKNETAEEKRQRKAGVKEMRRICRKMKKESKETYKAEAAKLPGQQAGTGDVRHKSRTFRL